MELNHSILELNISQLSELIKTREISPVELTQFYLDRIHQFNHLINAYLTICDEHALAQAQQAEKEILHGKWRGLLHGIPYGVKDVIDTKDILTTHGSSFFSKNFPTEDALCIKKLNAAGAIMLGKTLTHEFAAATTTINPHYGTARNPWNMDCITGGSSGGSAAAVAASLCVFTIGTDTGGSVRQPAALCGVGGMKPTHGLISLTGICQNAHTLDHVGVMSKYAQDTFFVTQVIAGYDANDAMSRKLVMLNEHSEWQDNMRGKNIALCPDLYLHSDMQIDVANAFDRVVKIFTDLGANIQTIEFEGAIRLTELFPSISGPEFAQFHRPFYESNPNAYSQAVRERVEWSLKVSADDYVNGLKERELLRRRFRELINKVDAIIAPSLPFTAPLISDLQVTINDKEESCMWLHRPFLNTPNIMGVPGVTVPMGLDHNNLPLSFQITGAELKEKEILEIASSYQRSNPMLLPPLFH